MAMEPIQGPGSWVVPVDSVKRGPMAGVQWQKKQGPISLARSVAQFGLWF